jgi:hypothetical protein
MNELTVKSVSMKCSQKEHEPLPSSFISDAFRYSLYGMYTILL